MTAAGRPCKAPGRVIDLDAPLHRFTASDAWTARDAFEGLQIFGSTGSGKTSGSGHAIARAFLKHSFGGLVLTAKPDEPELWRAYWAAAGRDPEHLLIFEPGGRWRFNFLDYEMRRGGAGAGLTENLANLFITVMETATGQRQGGSSDPYWSNALKQLLRNAIDLSALATGSVSLPDLARIVRDAPQTPEESRSPEWRNASRCFALLERGNVRRQGGEFTQTQARDFETTLDYWAGEFPRLSDKTRSIIVSSFTSLADAFLRGQLYDLFCSDTTIVPDVTHGGCVIVLALPVKEFGDVGRFAQILFKHLWQQATERRRITGNSTPVFLWADESQFFVTSHDALFQTTARAARAATVYLTQNISNYYAVMGGEHAKASVDSFLGNLNTKIFHANGDPITNQWAADLIAKTWQTKTSFTSGDRSSTSISKSLEFQIDPIEFTRLRKGGPQNKLTVEGVVFQAGRDWSTRQNFLRADFAQEQER